MHNEKQFDTLDEAERFFESLGKVPAKMIRPMEHSLGIYGYAVEWTTEDDYHADRH